MLRIVVLDGYTLNPGDLSWQGLEALGDCRVYDRTSPAEVVGRALDAEIVLTNKVKLTEEIMAELPRLRYIGVLATGYNVVDLEAATRRGIVVTNIPAYSTDSVAQMVFAHLLAIANGVEHYTLKNRAGDWAACQDFSYFDQPPFELVGKTMGIVGLGHIGMAVARLALAFGMRVIAMTSKVDLPDNIRAVDKETLFCIVR